MELTVTQLNTDNECTCVEDDIRLVKLNVLVACEYVENIESSNRTVKEGTRWHIHRCHYERYSRYMVARCVTKSVKNLSQLPSTDGLSSGLRPNTLVTDWSDPDFKRVNLLNFGDYV